MSRRFSPGLAFSVPEFRFPYGLASPGLWPPRRRSPRAPGFRVRLAAPAQAGAASKRCLPSPDLGPGTRSAVAEVQVEQNVTSKGERLQGALTASPVVMTQEGNRWTVAVASDEP